MNKIVKKIQCSADVYELEVEAPLIARERKAGQFVVFQLGDDLDERIPLTIADVNNEKGTITMVFQAVGESTRELATLKEGEYIANLLGPLGNPTDVKYYGRVVVVGGGIGVAPAYPIAQAMKDAGNDVKVIMGARTKDIMIFEDRMRSVDRDLTIVTDDGSYGRKGLVTEPLKELCESWHPDLAIAIGPAPMMKFSALTTKPYGIHTLVSLNTIMIDGTGMCGGCRVLIDGKMKFVCVDGPEFDGHKVDWDNLTARQRTFREREQAFRHRCNIDKMVDELLETPQNIEKTTLDEKAKLLLKTLPEELTVKDRMAIPAQEMPSQDPKTRSKNMNEVALGYTEDQAVLEAKRCLNCKNKPCVSGCPVSIDIPSFVSKVAERKFEEALAVIQESSLLPAICGRVCPQENQCQKFCTVGKAKGSVDCSVSIGRLERFVADWASERGVVSLPELKAPKGKKVAVVGSGPASIAAAADLKKAGYDVEMFEALHKKGGVLSYGIPEFRLPKTLVEREFDKLERMGVKIHTNFLVGRTETVEKLMKEDGFDAVFVGTGAGLPKFMNIKGESLVGVFSANEYLTRSNLMKAYDEKRAKTPLWHSDKVAVFGGGNVAMDAARTALRLGAKDVTIIYRRTIEEMPARREEVEHAKEEGVNFLMLSQPVEITGDESGKVKGVIVRNCVLGEPDASGRRRPVEVEGSDHELEFGTVIVAIGNASNPLIKMTTPDIEVNQRGNFIVDEETEATSIPGVFAGGDIVLGAATVILAMGQGRKAAKAIDEYLERL